MSNEDKSDANAIPTPAGVNRMATTESASAGTNGPPLPPSTSPVLTITNLDDVLRFLAQANPTVVIAVGHPVGDPPPKGSTVKTCARGFLFHGDQGEAHRLAQALVDAIAKA